MGEVTSFSIFFTGNKSALCALQVGQVISALVTKVAEEGILCQLDGDIKGFVTTENMPGINSFR